MWWVLRSLHSCAIVVHSRGFHEHWIIFERIAGSRNLAEHELDGPRIPSYRGNSALYKPMLDVIEELTGPDKTHERE